MGRGGVRRWAGWGADISACAISSTCDSPPRIRRRRPWLPRNTGASQVADMADMATMAGPAAGRRPPVGPRGPDRFCCRRGLCPRSDPSRPIAGGSRLRQRTDSGRFYGAANRSAFVAGAHVPHENPARRSCATCAPCDAWGSVADPTRAGGPVAGRSRLLQRTDSGGLYEGARAPNRPAFIAGVHRWHEIPVCCSCQPCQPCQPCRPWEVKGRATIAGRVSGIEPIRLSEGTRPPTGPQSSPAPMRRTKHRRVVRAPHAPHATHGALSLIRPGGPDRMPSAGSWIRRSSRSSRC
jgi:hypothetical protein